MCDNCQREGREAGQGRVGLGEEGRGGERKGGEGVQHIKETGRAEERGVR